MRFRNVPEALHGGLVGIQTEVRFPADLLEGAGEIQIGGRAVDRIAAEDEQRFHLAGVHVGDQLAQRIRLIDRISFDRIGVGDRFADVAERRIDGVRQGVDGGRLMIAGDHHARALVSLQVLRDGGDFFVLSAGLRRPRPERPPDPRPRLRFRWRAARSGDPPCCRSAKARARPRTAGSAPSRSAAFLRPALAAAEPPGPRFSVAY